MPKFILFIIQLILSGINCDEHNHRYELNEEVVLWTNIIGPIDNRQETYGYFSLPFCHGTKKTISHYHENLGEALLGTELDVSGIPINFKEPVQRTEYCQIMLDERRLEAFIYAVKNKYVFQLYIDDMPLWGNVGDVDESSYYIWTHRRFDFGYNDNRIVDINMTSDSKTKLEFGAKLSFTYEVTWKPSNIKFSDRFDKYLEPSFFQHRIHWFSIFNSFMMVVFLIGLVLMILLRTLKKDYARYSKVDNVDELERDIGDDYGWKQIHGDVFRSTSYPLLFSSLVGAGSHFAVVCFLVMAAAIVVDDIYAERGSMISMILFVFTFMSPVNGFVGGGLYARLSGKAWLRQCLFSALLIPLHVCGTAFFINFISMYYHASKAIPFFTMVSIAAICLFVICPLTLVGNILGRYFCAETNYPCRVNAVPRPIPQKKWFIEPYVLIPAAGILPFGSIFIEMYFIFTSFWAFKVYYVFGFSLLVFLMLAIVTSCVTIVCVYFLLNSEDYRWQWMSFLTASSLAFYVFLYSIYYFFFKTKMYGLFQTCFYFGYMMVFSVSLGIMCGCFGYFAANLFVRKIYSTVKLD